MDRIDLTYVIDTIIDTSIVNYAKLIDQLPYNANIKLTITTSANIIRIILSDYKQDSFDQVREIHSKIIEGKKGYGFQQFSDIIGEIFKISSIAKSTPEFVHVELFKYIQERVIELLNIQRNKQQILTKDAKLELPENAFIRNLSNEYRKQAITKCFPSQISRKIL